MINNPLPGKLLIASFVLISLITFYSITYMGEPQVIRFQDSQIEQSQNWSMYRLSVTHTGVAPSDCTVDRGLSLDWRTHRLNTGDYSASKSSPAVDEKRIYVGMDTGYLIALDRETGEILWRYKTRRSQNGLHGSPAIDPESNVLYIGAYDGWLYAVNKYLGTLVWEIKLGDYIGSSPVIYNGTVYIGVEMKTPAGYLVGVDTGSGKEVYRSEMFQGHPHSTPTIDPESGCILIGSNDSYLYCYWLGNQSERWLFKTGSDIKSTVAVSGGIAYVTSGDASIYAVNITTGKTKWVYSTSHVIMSSPTIDVSSGMVFFGTHGGTLYALDLEAGEYDWSFQTGDRITSSPTLVENTKTLVVGSYDGYVYLLDSETGEEKQRIELISGFTGVPVTVGSQLYLFDHLGYFYAYSN